MGELQGRRALVTGGTRGIGTAIAPHLRESGTDLGSARREFMANFDVPLGRPGNAEEVADGVT